MDERPQKPAGRGAKRVAAAVAACVVALLFFGAGWFGHTLSLGKRNRSLLWAVEKAKEEYYREVDEDALYDDFFSAFSFDAYSEYYPKEEYDAVLSSGAGQGADTGIVLDASSRAVRILRVKGNSPAERVGLRRGMYVYRYGTGEELTEGDPASFQAFLREQTEVVLECGFGQEGDAARYTLAREDYTVSYCLYRDSSSAFRFPDGTRTEEREGGLPALGDFAYVRIDQFYGKAAEEFAACLSLMKERGKKGLILDLRSNGGGYLDVFCDVAAYLLRNAEGSRPVVATAKQRSGKTHDSVARGNFFGEYFSGDAPVYLLADERTASASECLIGAMVSYGTLPTEHIFLRKEGGVARTYGKGIMQTTFTDAQGNALKLTTAEMFWPNGTSIHQKGVTEADGAVGVEAPLLPAPDDLFLDTVLRAYLTPSA